MANITPKSNGTYLIRISCGSDAAGKPISKSKIFKPSKPNLSYQKLNKEIDAFVKAFEEEIALYGIQERPDRIRFAEFCEKYLEVKKSTLAPTTYPFYENVVKEMLIPMFGTMRMRDSIIHQKRKGYRKFHLAIASRDYCLNSRTKNQILFLTHYVKFWLSYRIILVCLLFYCVSFLQNHFQFCP